jgi:hypothetical protein
MQVHTEYTVMKRVLDIVHDVQTMVDLNDCSASMKPTCETNWQLLKDVLDSDENSTVWQTRHDLTVGLREIVNTPPIMRENAALVFAKIYAAQQLLRLNSDPQENSSDAGMNTVTLSNQDFFVEFVQRLEHTTMDILTMSLVQEKVALMQGKINEAEEQLKTDIEGTYLQSCCMEKVDGIWRWCYQVMVGTPATARGAATWLIAADAQFNPGPGPWRVGPLVCEIPDPCGFCMGIPFLGLHAEHGCQRCGRYSLVECKKDLQVAIEKGKRKREDSPTAL